MPDPAYHSSNPSDPDVHHVYKDCPTGKRIPTQNRRPGKGGHRLCQNNCSSR